MSPLKQREVCLVPETRTVKLPTVHRHGERKYLQAL